MHYSTLGLLGFVDVEQYSATFGFIFKNILGTNLVVFLGFFFFLGGGGIFFASVFAECEGDVKDVLFLHGYLF